MWGFGGGDGNGYHYLSTQLSWPLNDPLLLLWPPGFPAVIALVSTISTETVLPFVVTLVNALLSSLTAVLSYRLALAIGLKCRNAIIAGLVCAIHPTMIVYGIAPMTESLFGFTLILAVLTTIDARRQGVFFGLWGLLPGLLMGSTALIRPVSWILALLAVGYWILAFRRKVAIWACVMVISTLLAWGIHNYQVWGVPDFSSNGTYNLLFIKGKVILHSATGKNYDDIPSELINDVEDRLIGIDAAPPPGHTYYDYMRVTDAARLSAMRSVALSLWIDHPAASIISSVKGVYATHFLTPAPLRYRAPVILERFIFVFSTAVLLLAFTGLVAAVASMRRKEIIMLAVIIGYLSATVALGFGGGDSRLIYAEIPILAVFVATGGHSIRNFLSARKKYWPKRMATADAEDNRGLNR